MKTKKKTYVRLMTLSNSARYVPYVLLKDCFFNFKTTQIYFVRFIVDIKLFKN